MSWVMAAAEMRALAWVSAEQLLAAFIVTGVGIALDFVLLRGTFWIWCSGGSSDARDGQDAPDALSRSIAGLMSLPPVVIAACALSGSLSGAEVVLWGAVGLVVYNVAQVFSMTLVMTSRIQMRTWPPSTMQANEQHTLVALAGARAAAVVFAGAFVA
jgi:hypothetical protein